jgi:tetratricopeptide (TPR) repeat protein
MQNRNVRFRLLLTLPLLAGLWALLLLSVPAGVPAVQAIGEVTPTPAPAEPTQPPTATPAPETEPDINVEAALDEALDSLRSGDSQTVIELLNDVIAAAPDNAEAYVLRGIAYNQQNRYDEAIADLTQAVELVPWSWEFITFRGDTYSQMGEYGEALFDYTRAIELNPRYLPAFQGRAQANASLGDTTASEIDDLIAVGLSRRGNGNNEVAVEFFTEAINTDADLRSKSAAYYNRALSETIRGNNQAAIDDYSAALDIYPEMHDSYLARGIAYRETDQIVEAGEDFIDRMTLLERESFEESLSVGESLTIEMAYGYVYRITFDGTAGETVTISARDADSTNVDPLIALQAPDGTTIAGDDDFGGGLDSQIEGFELPADGTYTLVVSHANGGFDGPVNVSVESAGS